MQILENSDAIVSDDESLELDCRIIVPKFKKEEYNSFKTLTQTSVMAREKQIRSESQEFRFVQFNQVNPSGSLNSTQNLIQCTLLNSDEELNNLRAQSHLYQEQGQNNTLKMIRQDNTLQSPEGSVEQMNVAKIQNIQEQNELRMLNEQIQPFQIQPLIRQNKRQLTQTFKSSPLEAQPIKITRFSQRQIYVTQLVNTNQQPLEEKLSLVQLENKQKFSKLPLSLFRSKTITIKYTKKNRQLKGILKSKLCNSEDGKRRKNRFQESKNLIKKVTFNSIEIPQNGSLNNKKEAHYQQQLIRIQ